MTFNFLNVQMWHGNAVNVIVSTVTHSIFSFELQTSNTFYPLTFESTIDSIQSQTFSPLHTSSPRTSTKPSNRSNISQSVHRSARNKYSSTDTSDSPYELPKKQNIRIFSVTSRSVKENNSEFKAALEYIKPDIICGTESWLRGKKPGKQYNKNAILNSLETTGALEVGCLCCCSIKPHGC